VTVYLVGAGPGDPGLLTRRGAALLARADVVVFDRLVAPELLSMAPADALRVDVGKRPGEDVAQRQRDINALLVEHGLAGRTVVRLKGGDPFVFGRGGEEAMALRDAGVAFEVVPGVTSAFAAPAYAGVPVTHRGLATSVTVVTGNVRDPEGGGVDWGALARAGGTVVVLMGMEHRAEIAARLMAGGRAPDTPVLVVHQGSTPAQRSVRTTLAGLDAVELGPPSTIVVGEVAGLELDWFGRGPLGGDTVFVTRAATQASPLVDALAAAGAQVRDLPLIAIADPPDGGEALRRAAGAVCAGAYDWVVCTSANAVERLVGAVRDGRELGATRLAAVGPATAAAFESCHLVPDLVPAEASAEGLVRAMPDGPGRVLYPGALTVRPTLAAGLRAKGWEVDHVAAYETVTRGPDEADTALRGALAESTVTFTSPSTVRAFVERFPGLVPGVVACIGPVTAEAAADAGLAVDAVADEHSAAGLVTALEARRRGRGPVPA